MYEIDKLSYLQIGVQGDNESTDIVIDVTAWAEKYPEAEFFIVFKPYNAQEISPMDTRYEDGILTWTVNSAATAVTGVGYTEIRAQDSHGLIKKSRIIPTAVENSVSGVDDTPPAAYQEWVTAVLNAGATAKNAAAAAMAVSEGREIRFEIGTDDSPTGTSGHLLFYYRDDDDEWAYLDLGAVDAYGLAKAGGYTGTKTEFEEDMGESGTNATAAANNAETAEAFAIGKRNGEDVTSGDAAYHNNSKYWSGIAEAAAATASAAYGTDLLAPAYTDLTFPVKKGGHCIYSGGYYEALQDIADSEVWTAAHWKQVTVGSESSDLKSALDYNVGTETVYLEEKKSITTDVNIGSTVTLTPSTSSTYSCAIVNCQPGDLFIISGTGGVGPRLWAFVDSDNKLLKKSDQSATANSLLISAPASSVKAVFNVSNGVIVKGKPIADQLADFKVDALAILKKDIEWKKGTVSSTGGIGDSETRIITSKFLFAKAGSTISVDDFGTYKIGIAKYTLPTVEGFTEYVGFASIKKTYTVNSDCYVIITMAYINDATITNVASVSNHGIIKLASEYVDSGIKRNAETIQDLDKALFGNAHDSIWKLGAIISTSGEETTADNRIVTYEYIHALPGSVVGLNDYTNYKVALAIYKLNNKEFVDYLSFTDVVSDYTISNECYIKICMAYKNNYAMDISYLSEYMKQLKTVFPNKTDNLIKEINGVNSSSVISNVNWTVRGINSNTGSLYNDNRRITTNLIYAKTGSTIALDDYTNYGFGIAIYTDDDISSFVEYVGFAQNKSTYTVNSDRYIVVSLRYEDNRAIEDISNLTSHATINIITEEHTPGINEKTNGIKELLNSGVSLTHRNYRGKKQYRIHIDEVIYALWDLATNNYESIFDESEFAEFKRIHDLYGTCFVLSLHYTQLEGIAWNAPFPSEMIGWSLEDMPDTWRDEFIENSNWLKFSFHAYAYEYRYEPGSTARPWEQDIIDMREQVVRFAGEETWIDEFVKTHGVVGDRRLVRIFMNQGAKYFEGDSEHVEATDPGMQSYYLTDEQQNKMFKEGTYFDPTNKALFIAGAGNLERLYGFLSGDQDCDNYLNDYVYNMSSDYRKKCDYMTFCSHESPMLGGMVIILNGVKSGDAIKLNDTTYTAGTDFAVGASDNATAENFYTSLGSDVIKYQRASNRCTVYAVSGTKSDSFIIRTPIQQIELVSKWCYKNGWEGHHLDEDSFYDF